MRNRNPKFGKHNRPNLFYPIYVAPNIIDKDGFSPVSLSQSNEYNIKIYPYNSEGKESCWRWGKLKFKENAKEKTLDCNLIAKKKHDGKFGIYEKSLRYQDWHKVLHNSTIPRFKLLYEPGPKTKIQWIRKIQNLKRRIPVWIKVSK